MDLFQPSLYDSVIFGRSICIDDWDIEPLKRLSGRLFSGLSFAILLLPDVIFDVDLVFDQFDDDENGEYESYHKPYEEVSSEHVIELSHCDRYCFVISY